MREIPGGGDPTREYTPEEVSKRTSIAEEQLDRTSEGRRGMKLGGSGAPWVRPGSPKNPPKLENTEKPL